MGGKDGWKGWEGGWEGGLNGGKGKGVKGGKRRSRVVEGSEGGEKGLETVMQSDVLSPPCAIYTYCLTPISHQ